MQQRKPIKPNACKYCGSEFHTSLACFNKPRKPIKKIGKRGIDWIITRREWIKRNPPDSNGYWYCHYCGSPLAINKDLINIGVMFMTLDHKYGRKGKLLTDMEHLVPSCYPDNRLKGSQDYMRFVERHYPELI